MAIRDYLIDNESAQASIVLLHDKDSADEGRNSERLEFPITLYDAVIGGPNVIEENALPSYDKAPFNILKTGAVEMTRDEIAKLFKEVHVSWII